MLQNILYFTLDVDCLFCATADETVAVHYLDLDHDLGLDLGLGAL